MARSRPAALWSCCSCCWLVLLGAREARALRELKITLSWGFATPDCVERSPLVLVNGQFPGPVIRVKAKELLEIKVANHIDGLATTLHFHGVDMKGVPWSDGASMVTDCPLPSGLTRTHRFHAPAQPGTHYYHGHVGLAKELGASGIFLVDPAEGEEWPETMKHDEDLPMFLQDWYHGPGLALLAGLTVHDFRWAGDPQSVLVNGRGHFDCEDNNVYDCDDDGNCTAKGRAVCTAAERPYYLPYSSHFRPCRADSCPGLYEANVTHGKTYFLRLLNGASLSMFNVAVEKHSLTIVEVDGEPVVPVRVSSIDLHSGQRVGALLVADQTPDTYWISVKIRGRNSPRLGRALLRYVDSKNTLTGPLAGPSQGMPRLMSLRHSQPEWDDQHFTLTQQRSLQHPRASDAPKPKDVHKRWVFVTTQEWFKRGESDHTPKASTGTSGLELGEGAERPEGHCPAKTSHGDVLRWTAGRKTYYHPETPALHQLYYHMDIENLTEDRGFYMLEPGKTYEVVLQNYPACNGVCETHPWHIHGHHLWVVGTWQGEFNGTLPAEGSGGKMHMRDTVLQIGAGEDHKPKYRKGCGYTVVRFVADNPGAWIFHCHIEWHQLMGMAMVFTYPSSSIPDPYHEHHVTCGRATPELIAEKWMQVGVAHFLFTGQLSAHGRIAYKLLGFGVMLGLVLTGACVFLALLVVRRRSQEHPTSSEDEETVPLPSSRLGHG